MRTPRRAFAAALAAVGALATGCAALGPGEPVTVDVVGLEPARGPGGAGRFVLRLRVLNPTDAPLEYDGAFVELEVRGARFAAGVTDARGTVPRYGEATIAVPVTVPLTAILRQALGLAGGGARLDYRLRGHLATPGAGRAIPFRSSGEVALPDPAAGAGSSRRDDRPRG